MAKILDVRVDNLTFNQVMAKINLFLCGKKLRQIVTLNPEFVLAAQKDKEFKKVLNQADLSISDGFGLKIAAAITGQKIGERITGVDLTLELAKLASERGDSIFFLGGAQGVAEKAVKRIKMIYPNLKVASTYAGNPDDKETIGILKKAKPDILLVAFGAPKQDKFIAGLKHRYSGLPKVAMGVGGTFDYISGNIPRAPHWMRKIGLEWLYRLFRQPSRFGRIFRAVAVFTFLVMIRRLLTLSRPDRH